MLPFVALAACTGPTDVGALSEAQGNGNHQPPAKLSLPAGNFSEFETLQVRPLALSPNGKLLFAVNTPDDRLEIFRVKQGGLEHLSSVAVGLEPVAVAARSQDEVWVVNHLSDSVSVVAVNGGQNPRVTRTLLVGDEPRDIVFANDRAFIATAHRGQNTGDAYDLQTPGVGRADVWVFDANDLSGQRLAKVTLFADTPRALAVSADKKTVYAAAFYSGNETTAVSPEAVKQVYAGANPTPGYPQSAQPPVGMVVKYKNGHWLDQNGKNFDAYVRITLPDQDVFAIDATAAKPTATAAFAHVGTTLFNMAVNPKTGKVYVTNTEARNDVRFEGHSPFGGVRGHITDSRITVIDPAAASVTPRLLNTHIDYTQDGNPAEKALSIAFPQDVVVSSDGKTLFTVAQGSSKLAIYDTAALEAGTATPSLSNQVVLSGGGPTGVVVDESSGRAFVLTRFDNSIKIVDVAQRQEVGQAAMFNPEPASVLAGRKFLYDANLTSQHGDTACASCHIGGDFDGLAWDLGNPGAGPLKIVTQVSAFTIPPIAITGLLPFTAPEFEVNAPLKGPMTTQSLRGMDNHGAMHWRGDRNGAVNQDGTYAVDISNGSSQPDTGLFDEVKAFTSFNVAFPGLVGRADQLTDGEMLDFAHFILQVMYPPNPVRNLDNSLTAEQQHGHDFYFAHAPNGQELPSDRFHNCNGCHTLNRDGNSAFGVAHPGFFGSDGRLSFEFESQIFKVPHLRNMYAKVGMFGSSPDSLQPGTLVLQVDRTTGKPIIIPATRGFGFNHDGVLGQLEHFFTGQVFLRTETPVTLATGQNVGANPFGIQFFEPSGLFANPPQLIPVEDKDPTRHDPAGFQLRHDIVAFMMAFDSNFFPIVGQQITLTDSNGAAVDARISLLEAQAAAGQCDLVVKGSANGREAGWLLQGTSFVADRVAAPALSDAQLRALVANGPMTFTCAPPGSGVRLALDRDGDGYANGDELAFGSDPADAASHP